MEPITELGETWQVVGFYAIRAAVAPAAREQQQLELPR